MRNIIIDGQKFDLTKYSSLEDLADTEFKGKDLSKIEVEDFEGIPYRLYCKTPISCTLEEALEGIEGLDAVFDWVDYVKNNPRSEEATIVYTDNFWTWDSDNFEDLYYGHFDSEEDFAENYLEDIGWETDLSDFFDYDRYGEALWEDLELNNYTPEALADYREELGLPEDYDNLDFSSMSRKELEMKYGFIGDDEDEEEEDTFDDNSNIDLTEAKEEYDRFVEDHSWEIYLAEHTDYADVAEEYMNESWGGIEAFARDNRSTMEDYIDIESFANHLFAYDFTYIDGYVFYNN